MKRQGAQTELVSGPLLELLAKPEEKRALMKTLDLPTHFATGDRALPWLLHAISCFIEKGAGKQGQTPKAHERRGTHELLRVQAERFLAIGSEDVAVPARREMSQQPLR